MHATSPVSPSTPLLRSLPWLAAYIVVLALVTAGLFYSRHQAFQTYGTGAARSAWTAWREDVAAAQETGSVRRRIPKSTEPPALVLMRDYFPICLTASLLLTSVLFATFMLFIRGVFASPSPRIEN